MFGRKLVKPICAYEYWIGNYSSAADIIADGKSEGDGVYLLNINGQWMCIYCDMSNGGYMLLGRGVGGDHSEWCISTDFIGDWRNPSPVKTSTFKLSDEVINWIRINSADTAYRVNTEGTYVNERYWEISGVYNHTDIGSDSENWISYNDEACTSGAWGNSSYLGSLSDYVLPNQAFALCRHPSIGWWLGDGLFNHYQHGTTSGCNLNIWIK